VIVRVPSELRAEARQSEAYRWLRRRHPALLLCVYGSGALEQIVILRGGVPTVFDVEDDDQLLMET